MLAVTVSSVTMQRGAMHVVVQGIRPITTIIRTARYTKILLGSVIDNSRGSFFKDPLVRLETQLRYKSVHIKLSFYLQAHTHIPSQLSRRASYDDCQVILKQLLYLYIVLKTSSYIIKLRSNFIYKIKFKLIQI